MIPSAKSLHFFTKIVKKTGIFYQIGRISSEVAREFAMIISVIECQGCSFWLRNYGGICE